MLTLEHIHIITDSCTHTPHTVHDYVNNYTKHIESPLVLEDEAICITPCHTQWLARHSDHRLSNSTTVHSCGIVFWGVALNEIHWYGIRGRVALEC